MFLNKIAAICLITFTTFITSFTLALEQTSCNCTEYKQPFQSLVKRRKRRGIIFPTGSTILFTHAITKVIIGATPKGLSISYEMDVYFPLPDTLEGLYPKKLLKKSKPKPTPVMVEVPKPMEVNRTYLEGPLYGNYVDDSFLDIND
uniref:Uncharacterized protein n=1 Tax=Megaselia scalaris TaxID=36166 RepID=T1GXA1_MEGSC